MEIAGIVVAFLGVLIGLLNWPLYIRREMRGYGPSPVPVVGVVFFTLGSIWSSTEALSQHLWAILIIDGAAAPMFLHLALKKAWGKMREFRRT